MSNIQHSTLVSAFTRISSRVSPDNIPFLILPPSVFMTKAKLVPQKGSRRYWCTIEKSIAYGDTYVQKLGLCVGVPRGDVTTYSFMSANNTITQVETNEINALFQLDEPFEMLVDSMIWRDVNFPGEEHLSVTRASDNKTIRNLPERFAFTLHVCFPFFAFQEFLTFVVRPYLECNPYLVETLMLPGEFDTKLLICIRDELSEHDPISRYITALIAQPEDADWRDTVNAVNHAIMDE